MNTWQFGCSAVLFGIILVGCSPPLRAQDQRPVVSLFGTVLRPVVLADDVRKDRLEKLSEAMAAFEESPLDPDAIIWLGRRTAYLGRYHEAIDIFTRGIELYPGDARMYRHRGHRYITTRQFGRAIQDLEHAATLVAGKEDEIEPDGLPNARNIPTSTVQANIWYHLGLARYLRGEFGEALRAYRTCLEVSSSEDMHVAASNWLHMTLCRLGRDAEAGEVLKPIQVEMDVIENDSYHTLLLFYKGIVSEEDLAEDGADAIQSVTVAYGLANRVYCEGDEAAAYERFKEILRSTEWAAFGYIAAEAEMYRVR